MEGQINPQCEERFKNINKRLEKLDKDSEKIKDQVFDMSGEIKSLVKSLQGLTDAIKFIGGPLLIGIVGFFFMLFSAALLNRR